MSVPAMILGAGLGTRLRPLTDWLAKPMVPVGDAPAVDGIAKRLRDRIAPPALVVNVHHRPNDLRRWAEPRGIGVSSEPELLGTAGGIHAARDLLGNGDLLVWNGDVSSDLDPAGIVSAHVESGALATLAVLPRARGEGNVGLASDGRVVRLRKSSFADEIAGADFVGIHVVGDAVRGALPERGCIVGDVYIPMLARGDHVGAVVLDPATSFVDIGTVASYIAANRAWLAARGSTSWVSADAAVRASVDGSVVGPAARVDAPALRCVVWPGTIVREPIEDAVVTPYGVVRPSG